MKTKPVHSVLDWMFGDALPAPTVANLPEDQQPTTKTRGKKSEQSREGETLLRWISEEQATERMALWCAERFPERREFWRTHAVRAQVRREDHQAHYAAGDFDVVARTKADFLKRVVIELPPKKADLLFL
ncbi:MAG: hypothetical protein ABI835_20270 [Chloroflexota bacterium]